jgi:hypothetical protein
MHHSKGIAGCSFGDLVGNLFVNAGGIKAKFFHYFVGTLAVTLEYGALSIEPVHILPPFLNIILQDEVLPYRLAHNLCTGHDAGVFGNETPLASHKAIVRLARYTLL